MSDIVNRVCQLVALAASSEEHEARTSAMLACQLIRQHKLVVLRPVAPTPPPKTAAPPPSSYRTESWPVPKTIVLMFGGACHTCKKRIKPGDTAWWRGAAAVYAHIHCSYDSLYENPPYRP